MTVTHCGFPDMQKSLAAALKFESGIISSTFLAAVLSSLVHNAYSDHDCLPARALSTSSTLSCKAVKLSSFGSGLVLLASGLLTSMSR